MSEHCDTMYRRDGCAGIGGYACGRALVYRAASGEPPRRTAEDAQAEAARFHQGREDYRGAFWFSLVPLALASVWMVWNLMKEKDPARRRKNSLIELAYCVGQLFIGLLTADGGIGLVGLALNLILCLFYVQWVNPRYMGRRFGRKK